MLKYQTFIKVIAGVTIIPFLLWNDSAWSQSRLRITRGICVKPIGRIVNPQMGRHICKGEQIYVTDNTSLICYLNQKVVKLQAGVYKTDSLCNPQKANTSPRCTLFTPEGCPNRKGPHEENENAPNIIQPYGNILVNNRPTISWVAVPGATSYTVQVKSYNVNWVKRVNGTTLPYPSDKEGLHYGSASKIIIIANKDDSAINADTLIAHLLPEPEVTRINQALQAMNSLNLPPDEVFVDLDAIYMSEGLLNETIETLKAQVAADSQNPTLYRILGDRYVQAWLPERARSAYTKAVQLATVQGKSNEEAIAKKRLGLLNDQSQLPTRINPAQ